MKQNRLAQLFCVLVLGMFLISCNASLTEEEDRLSQSAEQEPDDVSITEEETGPMEPAQPDSASSVDPVTDSQVEYASREEFLQAYYFDPESPFYAYYDLDGNPEIELFYDEASETGCGIRYYFYKTDSSSTEVGMTRFVFQGVTSAEWEAPDPFSTTSVHGDTGADYYEIEEYEETLQLNENGKPAYFSSQAVVTWLGGEQPQRLVEIEFIYREDGTLLQKKYAHNAGVFATPSTTRKSFYDEQERLIFEDVYHTHGRMEHYYLYNDGSVTPSYFLWLDFMPGGCEAELTRYDLQL